MRPRRLSGIALCSLSMALAGCGARATPAASPVAFDVRDARVVDLTHPFDAHTLYWPTEREGFTLHALHAGTTEGGYYYRANAFCAPEHGGTHLDAPSHFAERGLSVGAIPVERLVAPAFVVDARAQVARDRDYRLSRADLERFEAERGVIPDGAIVLMLTGWSSRWEDRALYFGSDEEGDVEHLHFPGFGEETARMLVEERHVAAIGLDTPSLDHGPSRDFPVHRVAAAHDVPGLENLDHLDALGEVGATIVALPLAIADGSGAPLRAIAIVPRPRVGTR